MTMRRNLLWAGLLYPALNMPLAAQGGDAKMGQQIAEEYCSACHMIDANGAFKQEPPSFAAIAVYRSSEQIRSRITTPIHANMPRYIEYMIGENIDDMVAYIVSLEE